MELTQERLDEYNKRLKALNKELKMNLAAESFIFDGKVVAKIVALDATPSETKVSDTLASEEKPPTPTIMDVKHEPKPL